MDHVYQYLEQFYGSQSAAVAAHKGSSVQRWLDSEVQSIEQIGLPTWYSSRSTVPRQGGVREGGCMASGQGSRQEGGAWQGGFKAALPRRQQKPRGRSLVKCKRALHHRVGLVAR
eukprot:scaffold1518_cov417-Prasinococcus_capsulatus_cf.AAC.20